MRKSRHSYTLDKLLPSTAATDADHSALTPDSSHLRLAIKLQWALALLGALAIAPLAYLTLQGLLGMMALLAAGTLGLATIQLAPALSLKLANLRIRVMREEVQANPIDVLDNELITRGEHLKASYESLNLAKAELACTEEDMALHAQQHPDDAAAPRRELAQLRALVTAEEAALADAERSLGAFKGQVARARSSWKLAMSIQRIASSLGSAHGDAQTQWQVDTALNAARMAMHHSFAQMDTLTKRRALAGLDRAGGHPRP